MFYPLLIENSAVLKDTFSKQFGDILGKKLKKKLEKEQDVAVKQIKYKQAEKNRGKKTLVMSLDGLLLQTSIFKEEVPVVDGEY